MFVSVKERARQIASGQFIAPPSSAPVASLIDLAPEPKPTTVATSKKASAKETAAKATASSSKTKLSKTAPPKDTPKAAPTPAAPPKAAQSKATPTGAFPQTVPTKPAPALEPSTPKKSSSKSKLTKEPSSKPSTPKIGSSKSSSSSKAASQPKHPPSPKIATPTKAAPSKSFFSKASSTPTKTPSTPTTPTKPKRSKSPPKRVDSPISDASSSDPLTELKSACLKQVSGVTGLGGRRLAIALKQRSSGEYYVALKDVGSDKYLKMWMNRDKTYETKEEALEKYLVWVSKMRNEVRWFPVGMRAGSPPAKGKK